MLKDGIVDQANIHSPLLISLYGGLGISLGLIMCGKRVIRTMGSNISRMTPSRYHHFPPSLSAYARSHCDYRKSGSFFQRILCGVDGGGDGAGLWDLRQLRHPRVHHPLSGI